MVFLVAQSGWFVERIADDLGLILEDHMHPGWRCNIWHVSGRDKDMLLVSVRGALRMAFSALLAKRTGEHTSL